MAEAGRRAQRVAQLIRDVAAKFLVTQTDDARLTRVVITDVRVSDDLSIVHLSFRLMTGQPSPEDQEQTLKQLQVISGRLRKVLGPQLQLRRVPELRFVIDKGYDAQQRVEQILAEIRAESKRDP